MRGNPSHRTVRQDVASVCARASSNGGSGKARPPPLSGAGEGPPRASEGPLSLKAGARLVDEHEHSDLFFAVIDGTLAASKACLGGGRQILAFFYPGDLILPGMPGAAWTVSVHALTRTRLEVYARDSVRDACHADADLGYSLFEAACRELSGRLEAAGRLRGLSAEGRIASLLLDTGRRLGIRQGRVLTIPLPMSRVEIASYLGLRVETVSRVLSAWRRDGLITLKNPRMVEVQDLAQLDILVEDSRTRNAV